uniref:Uncharacterized protein n=2 Tax=Ixodes ricinus TaxID=34613 RepID=V5IG20_IXORI
MRPEKAPMPTKSGQFCSPPETTLHEKENIATECIHRCFEESPPRLTYGRKKYNVTNGVECLGKNGKVGTCQYGNMQWSIPGRGVQEEDAGPFILEQTLLEKCTLRCTNGSDIQVENGTMCALRIPTRSFWSLFSSPKTFVEEIGVCENGTCVHREKYNATQEDSPYGIA